MNTSNPPTLPFPCSFENIFFITLRLRDALPESFGQNLALQYYSRQLEFARHPYRSVQLLQVRKRLFARFDNTLDLEKYGHAHLREPTLANLLAEEIHRHDGIAYDLLSYSILPNHVHLLLDLRLPSCATSPLDDLESLLHMPLRNIIRDIQHATEAPLKKALRELGDHIDPSTFQKHNPKGSIQSEGDFWHKRSFDFQVQNATEFEKIGRYILQNSLKAELVKDWRDWPFSYWKGYLPVLQQSGS